MSTAAPVARNRAICLQQELVVILRGTGSIRGAEQFWRHVDFTKGLGRKLACYGFAERDRQFLINKVAFPDVNLHEVDAALKAGNGLLQLHELASGRAFIARDSNNQYKAAKKGLKIIHTARASRSHGEVV
jgi:hypothetical protein